MMRITYYIVLIFILISVGCKKIYFGNDPENTPEKNFEIFWNDFDRYYPHFGICNVNWDTVYSIYRPKVKPSTSDRQLFSILAEMSNLLKDMHVNVYSPFGISNYNGRWFRVYPSGYIVNSSKYINFNYSTKVDKSIIKYGKLKNNNIGYISISTFVGSGNGFNGSDIRFLAIDTIMGTLKNTDGIIVDVRWNGGGNSANADVIAGRFADQKRISHQARIRNGPGKNDFSDWRYGYVEPLVNYQFLKPVVVLTSCHTASSSETFVMEMQVLPNVTIVGDTTGGGLGNPTFRELPNGWTYRLSTFIGADADGNIMENRGIYPDVPILTSKTDSINGVDRILEKGIEVIEANN